MNSDLENFVRHLGSASRVVALTGAGASAESGLPTFRDEFLDGLSLTALCWAVTQGGI
jgi:NAD-dependent SIR2 family protein deacetylase